MAQPNQFTNPISLARREEARRLLRANVSARAVARAVKLSDRRIAHIRDEMRNLGELFDPHSKHHTYRPEQYIAMDEKFKCAMLAAIKSGTENPPIGVYKCNLPISPVPMRFWPEPAASGCGSAAVLCMELGRGEGW